MLVENILKDGRNGREETQRQRLQQRREEKQRQKEQIHQR
jgi:hypothetical protein